MLRADSEDAARGGGESRRRGCRLKEKTGCKSVFGRIGQADMWAMATRDPGSLEESEAPGRKASSCKADDTGT